MTLVRSTWDWVGKQFVGEVPEDDAVCEFDCRQTRCREGEWEGCPRRLLGMLVAQESVLDSLTLAESVTECRV